MKIAFVWTDAVFVIRIKGARTYWYGRIGEGGSYRYFGPAESQNELESAIRGFAGQQRLSFRYQRPQSVPQPTIIRLYQLVYPGARKTRTTTVIQSMLG